MTEYYEYRVRCTTHNKFETWVLKSTDPVPTTCPSNTAHTIDTAATTIVDTISDNVVKIREESTPTGGHYHTTTLKITADGGTTGSATMSWPHPISALALDFISIDAQKGDFIDVVIGENTIVGAITANVSSASAWSAQNYVVGDIVTYTHPVFGSRVYTCMTDTVSNDLPTNIMYWRHGLEVSVSQTVIDYTKIGFYIQLFDGTNVDNLKRVLYVDTENKKIYLESNTTNSYSAATPTYVQRSVYVVKDYEMGAGWEHIFGRSKIGGNYIPADIVVRVIYTNNGVSTQDIIGQVEILC